MYIILTSSDGGGAGTAYGPYETEEEAKKYETIVIKKWAKENNMSVKKYLACDNSTGPWLDILLVKTPEELVERA